MNNALSPNMFACILELGAYVVVVDKNGPTTDAPEAASLPNCELDVFGDATWETVPIGVRRSHEDGPYSLHLRALRCPRSRRPSVRRSRLRQSALASARTHRVAEGAASPPRKPSIGFHHIAWPDSVAN